MVRVVDLHEDEFLGGRGRMAAEPAKSRDDDRPNPNLSHPLSRALACYP